MERKTSKTIKGFKTKDGAGVNLVRVLGHQTAVDFDPILMLDSFDSTNPPDYIAGFPMHPHRGIETISYVSSGKMTHKDSLGNSDTISSGEVQWMRAGSGILHEEKLPAVDRLLGVQLWLNLPKNSKMVDPMYRSIKNSEIPEVAINNGKVRVLAGTFNDENGYINDCLPVNYYDIQLKPNATFSIDTKETSSIMLFTLTGNILFDGEVVEEKTAVKLTQGDKITIKSLDTDAQVLYIESRALKEPIVWGGPIVMNSKAELNQAFEDLDNGTFLKTKISY
ncbi:MAG: pirin family protein [Sphaerochaetaceae bacterium]|nr:pirin family protein [Sphaerochaetaceae bacterium]NLY07723.1 pirin family protein [Spirochaetales bacterium]